MPVIAYKKDCDCGSYFVWRSGTVDEKNVRHTWSLCYSLDAGLSV